MNKHLIILTTLVLCGCGKFTAISSTQPNSIYLATYSGLYFQKADSGKWLKEDFCESKNVCAVQPLSITSTSQGLFVGTIYGGMLKVRDFESENFEQMATYPGFKGGHAFEASYINSNLIVGSAFGVMLLKEGRWEDLLVIPRDRSKSHVSSLIGHKNFIYAVSKGGSFFESRDQGQTWSENKSGSVNESFFSNSSTAVYLSKVRVNEEFVYVASRTAGIARKRHGSNLWQTLHFEQEGSSVLNNVTSFYVDGPLIYVSVRNEGLLSSSDNGESWSNLIRANDPSFPEGFYISAVLATNDSIYIGSRAGELFVSSDQGMSWGSIKSPADDNPIYDIFVDQ